MRHGVFSHCRPSLACRPDGIRSSTPEFGNALGNRVGHNRDKEAQDRHGDLLLSAPYRVEVGRHECNGRYRRDDGQRPTQLANCPPDPDRTEGELSLDDIILGCLIGRWFVTVEKRKPGCRAVDVGNMGIRGSGRASMPSPFKFARRPECFWPGSRRRRGDIQPAISRRP